MGINLIELWSTQSLRIRRLSKEGGWILTGQIASLLGSLVLVRVLTDYLDPVKYGELALGLTIASLVNQVFTGGVIVGIGRFYSIAAEKCDLAGYLHASKRLLTYSTLIVSVLSMIFMGGLVVADQKQWIPLAMAALILSIISSYNSALNVVQNSARQRAVVALHSSINAWLKIGLAIGMMLWLGASATMVVIGYIVAMVFVSGSQLIFIKQLMRRKHVTHIRKGNVNWQWQIWLFSWPIMAGGLFNWGYYASQRWSLELFVTTAEVGKFYALTQVAYSPVVLAFSLFMSFLTPILYARVGDPGNLDRVEKTNRLIFSLAIISIGIAFALALLAFLTHELIFTLLVADQYRNISIYMPIMVLSAGILSSSHLVGSSFFVQNKTKKTLSISFFVNPVVAVINLVATFWFGFAGLLVAILLGSCLHFLWTLRIAITPT